MRAIKKQLGEPQQIKEGDSSADLQHRRQVHRKRTVWISIIGLSVVLLGAAALLWNERLFPGPITTVTENQEYNRQITSLDLDIESGDVQIRPGTDGKVSIERHFKWSGKKPTFTEKWDDTKLRISTDCPEDQRNCSLGYVVYVPDTVAVDAHTDAGRIDVEGVDGGVRLQTSAGNIDASDVTGAVWARVSDGNITVSGQSAEVDVQASSGNIDLRFDTAPAQVKAKTASGSIEVIVPFGDAYAVRADTSSGRRTISVQQATAAERSIDIQTSSGNVTVQYPQN